MAPTHFRQSAGRSPQRGARRVAQGGASAPDRPSDADRLPIGAEGLSGAGRPLTLDDRHRLADALSAGYRAPSEYAFANLFLFRQRHGYRLHDGPLAHLSGMTYDGRRHALPLVPLDRQGALALLGSGVDCIYPIGEHGRELGGELGLLCTQSDADSDYWYSGPDLATLSGAKQRRAQAREWADRALPVVAPFGPGEEAAARHVLAGWQSDVARAAEATDVAECHEAIGLAAALGLEGLVVRTAEGEPVAFLLASAVGDVRIIHFAKGRREHSGAYPWMFARYAAESGAAWLNFEQDLGKPGLAQSKRAYSPVLRQPKWRLSLPHDE